MNNFIPIFLLGLKRRLRDFFILFYNLVFPLVLILLLGYLTSTTYTQDFSSYTYYSLVLVPFFLFLSITTCAYNATEESLYRVSHRFAFSPTSRGSLVVGKILSSFMVLAAISTLLIVLLNLFFSMHLGVKLWGIVLLYSSIVFMTASLGYFIGYTFKNNVAIRNYINLPISIFAFLGGSFFPVGSFNPYLRLLFKLSPLYWINRSVFLYLYDQQIALLLVVTCIVTTLGLIFLLLSPITFKREVFLS